jgi:NTE family protein
MNILNKDLNKLIENEVKSICDINKSLKNILVMAGGGMKGIYLIGCLKYIEEKNLLKNITTYAGTSIGGIISFMLNIDYSVDEIYKFSKSFDFSRSTDINISTIMNTYSFSTHDNFDKVIINIMRLKNIDPSITLIELYKKTKKKLILTTVCLDTKSVEYLSYEIYPELPVITALKMTSSVPLLFPFVKYNNKKYVDGGILDNFPISIFENQLENVIGLNIYYEISADHNSLFDYILLIFGIFYLSKSDKYCSDKYKKSVFNFKSLNNNTFNFELTSDKKKEMYYEGYNNIKNNFNIE